MSRKRQITYTVTNVHEVEVSYTLEDDGTWTYEYAQRPDDGNCVETTVERHPDHEPLEGAVEDRVMRGYEDGSILTDPDNPFSAARM